MVATGRPAPLACDECRRKHLKCNGITPCQRCAADQLPCFYTASRRGRVKRKKRATYCLSPPSEQGSPNPAGLNALTLTADINSAVQLLGSSLGGRIYTQPLSPQTRVLASPGSASDGVSTHDRDQLLNIYFTQFHPAHPLLVPKAFYTLARYPAYLDAVVCLIAHRYTVPMAQTSEILERSVIVQMAASLDEVTVHRVQALLLFCIYLHTNHQPHEATQCIARAVRIATGLGLNRPSFAGAAAANAVQQESLRRTWWELHITDIYLAALHRRPRTQAPSEAAEGQPHLPSAESEYTTDFVTPVPRTLADFDQRVFMDDGYTYPSSCYRIEASFILERVLNVTTTNDVSSDSIQAIDNALASWKYNLPAIRSEVIDASGEVDQMLFQAHTLIHCASIFLHFPRSDLPASVPTTAHITGGNEYQQLLPASAQHTVKAVAASKELSNLAAIPWPVERHSPLFACALILGCVVQLAAASIHLHQCGYQCLQQHRDRVVLMMGALKMLGKRWSVAANALTRLKPIAHMIFSGFQPEAVAMVHDTSSSGDSGFGAAGGFNELSWFDLFEPEVIESLAAAD